MNGKTKGPGWQKRPDGRVLFRPNRRSETYKITPEDLTRIQVVKRREIFVAIASAPAFAVPGILWIRGDVDLAWLMAGLALYAVVNVPFCIATNREVRRIALHAVVSGDKIEFPEFHAVLLGFGKSAWAGYVGQIARKLRMTGIALFAYGLSSLVLSLAGPDKPAGIANRGIAAACLVAGGLLLLFQLLRASRRD